MSTHATSAAEPTTRWVALALVVGLGLVFGPAVRTPWLWDDHTLIRESPVLGHPELLGQALRQDFWAISVNPRAQGMYRPLVTVSYFADRALFGTSPLGPHVVNLLLHAVCCVLLAALAVRLGSARLEALLAAALFGFHPVVVEALANVSSRGDLLAGAFLLAALLVLRRTGWGALAAAAGLVALAQLSKEAAMVALPLALLVEWAGAGFTIERRRVATVSIALGAVTAAVLVLRATVLGSAIKLASDAGWRPVLSGASGLVRYASRLVWPSPLVPYQPPTETSVVSLVALASVAVLVALAGRRARWLWLGALWLLFATAPVAGWLPINVRFSGLLLYLPLMGVALAAARGLGAARPAVRWVIPVALAALSAVLVQTWSSAQSLWQTNVEAWPELVAPRLNLANALAAGGSPDAAFEAYGATVSAAHAAGDTRSLALAELGLGNLLLPSAPAEAATHFRSALTASSGHLWQAALNLAVALVRAERGAEAAEVLEAQWAITPLRALAEAGAHLARQQQDEAATQRWRSRVEKPAQP